MKLVVSLDGKPLAPKFRVFLATEFGAIEAAVDNAGFVVPNRFSVLERVGVRVEVDGFTLDLGDIYTSKFACDWNLAIDTKPFALNHVDSPPGAGRNAHLIVVISFDSHLGDGTELVCTWYDDSYHIADAVPPN